MKERLIDDQTVGVMLTNDEVCEEASKLSTKMMNQFHREDIDPRVIAVTLSASLVMLFVQWGFPLETLEHLCRVMISDYKHGIKKKESEKRHTRYDAT